MPSMSPVDHAFPGRHTVLKNALQIGPPDIATRYADRDPALHPTTSLGLRPFAGDGSPAPDRTGKRIAQTTDEPAPETSKPRPQVTGSAPISSSFPPDATYFSGHRTACQQVYPKPATNVSTTTPKRMGWARGSAPCPGAGRFGWQSQPPLRKPHPEPEPWPRASDCPLLLLAPEGGRGGPQVPGEDPGEVGGVRVAHLLSRSGHKHQSPPPPRPTTSRRPLRQAPRRHLLRTPTRHITLTKPIGAPRVVVLAPAAPSSPGARKTGRTRQRVFGSPVSACSERNEGHFARSSG